jgi:2-polyprenyl-6-methoxyphenol hydroxylase-like FAD-dependent oxidoreductase
VANFACERAHGNVAYQWFQGGPVLALLPLPERTCRWSGRCLPMKPHA